MLMFSSLVKASYPNGGGEDSNWAMLLYIQEICPETYCGLQVYEQGPLASLILHFDFLAKLL